jgi:sugar phosphate permease
MDRKTQLRLLIGVHLVWTFLLTPAAFETRPFSSFNPIGFASLALIFTTVTLDIVTLLIVQRRTRLATALAMVGTALFIPPFLVDQAGLFSTLGAPTAIVMLEYAALITQLAIGYVAYRLRQGTAAA